MDLVDILNNSLGSVAETMVAKHWPVPAILDYQNCQISKHEIKATMLYRSSDHINKDRFVE